MKPFDWNEEKNAWLKYYQEVVDPRLAPEMVSVCFLQSVFKGLHKAPRIGKGLSYNGPAV